VLTGLTVSAIMRAMPEVNRLLDHLPISGELLAILCLPRCSFKMVKFFPGEKNTQLKLTKISPFKGFLLGSKPVF
jgi:hypothetical protein